MTVQAQVHDRLEPCQTVGEYSPECRLARGTNRPRVQTLERDYDRNDCAISRSETKGLEGSSLRHVAPHVHLHLILCTIRADSRDWHPESSLVCGRFKLAWRGLTALRTCLSKPRGRRLATVPRPHAYAET